MTAFFKSTQYGTSLVVQWLRLHAPKAGAWVPFLVGALDPTCCNEAPACHNQKRSHVYLNKGQRPQNKNNEVKYMKKF